jgi:hypothetical protein
MQSYNRSGAIKVKQITFTKFNYGIILVSRGEFVMLHNLPTK